MRLNRLIGPMEKYFSKEKILSIADLVKKVKIPMKLLQNISLNSNKMVVKRCYLPNWDIIYDKECTTLFSKGQTDPDMQWPWSNNICSLCTTCNKQISSVPWKCKIDCTRLYWEKGLESSLRKMPNFMNFFLSRGAFLWQTIGNHFW